MPLCLCACLLSASQTTSALATPARKRTCFHVRCAVCDTEHEKNDCVLVGVRVIKAHYDTPCEICKDKFVTVRQEEDLGAKADKITHFGDLGYVHVTCLVPLLRLARESALVPTPERVQRLIVGVPVSVARLFVRLAIGDLSSAAVRIVNAVPGAGKSWLLVLLYSLVGIRRAICLTFNTGASSDLRVRKAVNTFTYNALGMRGDSSGVLTAIQLDKAAGFYTPLEAPAQLMLSLVRGCKVTILLHHLYPPVKTDEADGITARMSIHVIVCGDFLGELYPLALANAFGAVVEDNLPSMEDIGALMSLAMRMLVHHTLEKKFAALSPTAQARWAAICNGATPAARLAYACALMQPLHEASLQTTTQAAWVLPSGQRLTHIQGPGMKDPAYKLPATCYGMQVSLKLYRPELVKVVTGTYDHVLGDETQDSTKARELFLREVVKQSNVNGGPGHTTTLTIVGDDDQSITGWSGGLTDPFASARFTFGSLGAIVEPALLCSLRVPSLLCDYAVTNYKRAYSSNGYANEVIAPLSAAPDAVGMMPAPNAVVGILETSVNFHAYPLLKLAALGKVIVTARRHATLLLAYDLFVKRDIPCCLIKVGDELIMPLLHLHAAVDRVASRISSLGLQLTATVFLETLQFLEDGPIRSCLSLCVRRFFHPPLINDNMNVEDFKSQLAARFSPAECQRIEIMTAHATKGKTTRTLVKLQPNDFPLARSLEDGGIFLEQEPKVAYVSETRQTHLLLEAEHSTGSEDKDLESILFPQDVPLALELPYKVAQQDQEELQRSAERALSPGYSSGIVSQSLAAQLVAEALAAPSMPEHELADALAPFVHAVEEQARCDRCGEVALLHESAAGDDVCDACAEA